MVKDYGVPGSAYELWGASENKQSVVESVVGLAVILLILVRPRWEAPPVVMSVAISSDTHN